LWHDEVITFITAIDSPFKIMTDPYDMNIPPLYYLIEHLVLRLGHGEFILRLPSVIVASLSIPTFFGVLSHGYGRAVGIAGAGLMVLSPLHVWYSQEARPYALLVFLSLVSIWCFQRLIDRQANLIWSGAFVIFTALVFYAHTVGIALIGSMVVYVLMTTSYTHWKQWFARFAMIGLFIAPAIYRLLLIPPVASANEFDSSKPLASIAYTLWAFGTGFSFGPTVADLHMPDRASIIWGYLPLIVPVMLVLCFLSIFGAFQLLREDRKKFWFTTLWLCFPLGFALLGSMLTVHPFNVRYSILAFPPFLTLISVGIVHTKNYWARSVAAAGIVLISLGSLTNYFFNERYHRDDNRSASQFLSLHAVPNDLVIASAAYTAPNLRYYYQGEPIKIVGYPTHKSLEEDNSIHPDPPGALYVENDDPIGRDIEHIIGDRQRFWLFLSRIYDSDPYGAIPGFLNTKYSQKLSASWPGTQLILYENRRDSNATGSK
jgi:4-amino-4-deoxy-L-arabinose transferase-like glycosyltransferase